MAVTQQLARIPAEYLAACRQSASASPDGDPHWDPPPPDVLDLDWASTLLIGAGEPAGLDDVHLDALRQATSGDTALDLRFLTTHPHAVGPFGPPPTTLATAQVVHVSALLAQIDMPVLLAALPTDDSEAASLIGHGADQITGGPRSVWVRAQPHHRPGHCSRARLSRSWRQAHPKSPAVLCAAHPALPCVLRPPSARRVDQRVHEPFANSTESVSSKSAWV
ncbi:hypothetical protein [Streptomyces sp. enrichment culture]|uniref:hypothetical protein n=1 Tax=Streptomyces sp. enrichment culture TaxID=1795815 RepID=UPI003F55F9BE